jgi:hypothetical protein
VAVQHAQPGLWALPPFFVSINLLALALENLFFLWFPSRQLAAAPGDMQNFGRVLLIWLAKLVVVMVLVGVASLVGVVAYFLAGESYFAAGLAAWLVITAGAAATVPLLSLAFDRYDVARDTPP